MRKEYLVRVIGEDKILETKMLSVNAMVAAMRGTRKYKRGNDELNYHKVIVFHNGVSVYEFIK